LWPSGIALRGEIPNRPELRWLKTVVVSVREKARWSASGGDREDERKRTADEVPKSGRRHRNRGGEQVPGQAWQVPAYGPGGVRHEGGVSPVCGFYAERGKADHDTTVRGVRVVRGSASSGRNREALSTDAWSAGGPARSSDDARVIAGTAKGPALPGCVRSSNQRVLGGIE
jgi:hypothetical protein